MSLLFETIRVEQGRFQELARHEERMHRSRQALLGCTDRILLGPELRVPAGLTTGSVKCRVEYGRSIERVTFEAYRPRTVVSLRLVTDDRIEYGHKFSDRSCFENHLKHASADDILIVRNGFITDTSYSNIAFESGPVWVTPAVPLLPGVMRQRLLEEGRLQTAPIRPADLSRFTRAMLLNAMLDPGIAPVLPMTALLP